jgi:cysteinyl-tRNA synthetase
MRLFNTETQKKEEIVPQKGKKITLYTCGPTVYNFAHIGNFRTYVFEDILRRALKTYGFSLTQAMNITDVEDKIIRNAIAEDKDLKSFTDRYTQAFFEDLHTLNMEKVEFYPHATDFIPQMIEIIERLLKNGMAYKGNDGSIYYAISTFSSYGRLAHFHLEELQAGASKRNAVDEYDKDQLADFALWKAYDPARDGNVFWESPFGRGRPGWHIECSAMAMTLLGDTVDIHVGGVDNMFPHHENEIAQSEAFSQKQFVRYWLHVEHLLVDHKKMSKSLGNFFTLRDLLEKGYTGTQVRYLLLQVHYRTQCNFTLAGLDAAANSLERLKDFIFRLQGISKEEECYQIDEIIVEAESGFFQALYDDINISPALAALFDFVRRVNVLCDLEQIGRRDAERVLCLLKRFDKILGVLFLEAEGIPQDVEVLFLKRQEARLLKDWKLSDYYRDQIDLLGYLIEDTPKKARLKKKP